MKLFSVQFRKREQIPLFLTSLWGEQSKYEYRIPSKLLLILLCIIPSNHIIILLKLMIHQLPFGRQKVEYSVCACKKQPCKEKISRPAAAVWRFFNPRGGGRKKKSHCNRGISEDLCYQWQILLSANMSWPWWAPGVFLWGFLGAAVGGSDGRRVLWLSSLVPSCSTQGPE